MKNVKLSPPWYTYNNEIKALFELDPDIEVGDIYEPDSANSADLAMNIQTTNQEKFLALNKVINPVVDFGNIKLHVLVQDISNAGNNPYVDIYSKLFESNRRVKEIMKCTDFAGQEHVFIEFQPEVIQFYNDNINDYYGNFNGLAQDIAQEIFADATSPFVHFCTASLKENDEPIMSPE